MFKKITNFFSDLAWIIKTAKEYRAQDSNTCACTASPIFVVQCLENIGIANEDYHAEGQPCGNYIDCETHHIFGDAYEAESYSAKEALEILIDEVDIEALNPIDDDSIDDLELAEKELIKKLYDSDFEGFKEYWENSSEGGREVVLGIYGYGDREYFLTRDAAEEHIKAKAHRYRSYRKPRIFVKSLARSYQFKNVLEFFGFTRR